VVPRFLNAESGPSPHILARSTDTCAGLFAGFTPFFANLRHFPDVSRVGHFVGAFTLFNESLYPVEAWVIAVGAHYYAFFGIGFSPRPILSISLK
jgi:hypothetical protein